MTIKIAKNDKFKLSKLKFKDHSIQTRLLAITNVNWNLIMTAAQKLLDCAYCKTYAPSTLKCTRKRITQFRRRCLYNLNSALTRCKRINPEITWLRKNGYIVKKGIKIPCVSFSRKGESAV